MNEVTFNLPKGAPPMEDFEALLNESFGKEGTLEGTVVRGTILKIASDYAS